ncbi:MAG: MerR family transcriptional regulator [Methanomassiliicoccaceae archaeon]|nr:MerR family transcriptional regulator [Methanomassiliicoccaceae archaeon]
MTYSITEAGKRSGLSVHTLRYYEKDGLMPEIRRDEKGGRTYTDTDIVWISLVRCLREADMPIHLIRGYIDLVKDPNSTTEDRRSVIVTFRNEVDAKMRKFAMAQRLIDKKLELYDAEMNAGADKNACRDRNSGWDELASVLEGYE